MVVEISKQQIPVSERAYEAHRDVSNSVTSGEKRIIQKQAK